MQDLQLCEQSKCPEVSVHYIQAKADEPNAAQINELIQSQVGYMISGAVLPEGASILEIEPAVKAFVKNFQDYYGDFPEDALTYELEIENRLSYSNEDLISIQTTYYAYTGGAHGYGTMEYLIIDPEKGTLITLEDLIEDVDGFKAFAEEKFKADNGIDANADVSDGIYYFEDDVFYLPAVYGFTEDGMEFYFTTYEIGSYADGPVTLAFSWEEIEPWLSIPVPAS